MLISILFLPLFLYSPYCHFPITFLFPFSITFLLLAFIPFLPPSQFQPKIAHPNSVISAPATVFFSIWCRWHGPFPNLRISTFSTTLQISTVIQVCHAVPKEVQVAVLAVHSSPSGLVAHAFSILVIIVNESGTFAACQHQHTLSKVKTQNKFTQFYYWCCRVVCSADSVQRYFEVLMWHTCYSIIFCAEVKA